jgi:hypothetical protein
VTVSGPNEETIECYTEKADEDDHGLKIAAPAQSEGSCSQA